MNNLITRTVSGIFFVAVMVGAILYDAKTFIVLFGIITALAVWEFCTLVNNKRELQVNRLISTAAGLYLYLAMMAFCTGASGAAIFIPYLITLMYLLISGLYMRSPRSLENWVFAFASQLYIALPFALMNVLAFRMQSGVDGMSGLAYIPALPLGLMIFLWTNDMGAYCFGSMLQRFVPFKLFPSVSPHKSWIGSIGGGLVTVIAAIIMSRYFTFMPPVQWVGMALVVVVFGTWGDLVESLLKRNLGVKDSGRFLPGHGGVLDRFDSSLLAIPAVVLYLYTLEIM